MSKMPPRITVVMPVHNGEDFIFEAVKSVLAQTCATFVLLVVDDGSQDRTGEILAGFDDPRLRVLDLPGHPGLVAALNHGLAQADTEYIARMDADDVCRPDRFERQVAFLDAQPHVALCGTWSREVGSRFGPARRPPCDPEALRARMLFGGAVAHSSMMYRSDFIRRNRLGYSGEYPHAEDYDFASRAAEMASIANLPEVLMHHRVHPGQVSAVHSTEQAQSHCRLVLRELAKLAPEATGEEKDMHLSVALGSIPAAAFPKAERWLLKLKQANLDRKRYETKSFDAEVDQRWFYAHSLAKKAGLQTLRSYWLSPLRDVRTIGVLRHARLASRCFLGSVASRRGA